MPTNLPSTNLIPSAQEGLVTSLAATANHGDTTVSINGYGSYTNGSVVVLALEPALPTHNVITGVLNTTTTPVTVTSVAWTEGGNNSHLTGSAVYDYVSATHFDMVTKAMAAHANQDGSLKTTAVQTALNLGTSSLNGWNVLPYSFNTVTYNGNHSYTCVISGHDVTGTLSPGMRLQTQRTVASPIQSASLNGTNQYFNNTSPAGMTFTNNFVVSAWVRMTSYQSAVIASRYNGTSGWQFYITSSGQVTLQGLNGGSGNNSQVNSYQSIPLNKWVHVAAQLDMATFTATPTTSYAMIDGVDVPASVTRAGTNPTALIQAGNLEIGSTNGGLTNFPGKIAQVAIYSAKVTQATIQATISQGLAGTETSLISAYSLNNSINDLNANANNLTANGGATTTAADAPFGGQAGGTISSTLNYGIVTSAVFSTNTTLVVQVPEGCAIATSGGVASVSYSSNKAPYGFPGQRGKWRLQTIFNSGSGDTVVSGGTSGNWYNPGNFQLNTPIGEWMHDHSTPVRADGTGGTTVDLYATLSTSSSSESDKRFTRHATSTNVNPAFQQALSAGDTNSVSSMTPFYGLIKIVTSTTTTYVAMANSGSTAIITAECAHL